MRCRIYSVFNPPEITDSYDQSLTRIPATNGGTQQLQAVVTKQCGICGRGRGQTGKIYWRIR